jgi:molybdate transport system ATP-binding protein
VSQVEPLADLIRVRAGELAADITVQAAADLDLEPHQPVAFSVKATEVAIYAL